MGSCGLGDIAIDLHDLRAHRAKIISGGTEPAASISVITSRAPSAANSSAVARPMPFAAPVTTADLPLNRPGLGYASLIMSGTSHLPGADRICLGC